MSAPLGSINRGQTVIYRAATAPDLTDKNMTTGAMRPADVAGYSAAMEVGLKDSALIRLLFADEQSGVSLTYAWFKANATLPRHSHSADCLYYIISGSLKFGSEDLGPGDGFLVPSDTLYSYEAGADGVEVLEFRTATKFDISFSGTEASWNRIIETVKRQHPIWESMDAPPAARRMMSRTG